jgi:hypothetical protein
MFAGNTGIGEPWIERNYHLIIGPGICLIDGVNAKNASLNADEGSLLV